MVALAAVALLSATTGAAALPFGDVLASLVDRLPLVDVDTPLSSRQEGILFQIRLPRLVLGMLVGGSLAMAGAAYQGVFRNPLADPYLLGVSAGAGFGAVLALGFGLDVGWGPFDALPAAAFLGALVAVSASAAIARGAWRSPATLLLGGIAMAAFFSAAQTYAIGQLPETRTREVLSWLFGQLSTNGWRQVWILGPLCGRLRGDPAAAPPPSGRAPGRRRRGAFSRTEPTPGTTRGDRLGVAADRSGGVGQRPHRLRRPGGAAHRPAAGEPQLPGDRAALGARRRRLPGAHRHPAPARSPPPRSCLSG